MNSSRTLKILLAYDGGEFKGFAVNPGVLTVGGKLQDAFDKILPPSHHETEKKENTPQPKEEAKLKIVCAGRTDAGVHAWGQVVSVSPVPDLPLSELKASLQALCGPSILIREVSWAEEGFDARASAKSRLYYYHISNRPDSTPLIRNYCWQISDLLDLRAMKKPLRCLLGENDFTSFCKKPPRTSLNNPEGKPNSLIRHVFRAGWEMPDKSDPSYLRFYIEANAFCHQMVRSIVGTLVEMGKGQMDPKSMAEIVESKDRSKAGQPAPSRGLTLQEVSY